MRFGGRRGKLKATRVRNQSHKQRFGDGIRHPAGLLQYATDDFGARGGVGFHLRDVGELTMTLVVVDGNPFGCGEKGSFTAAHTVGVAAIHGYSQFVAFLVRFFKQFPPLEETVLFGNVVLGEKVHRFAERIERAV